MQKIILMLKNVSYNLDYLLLQPTFNNISWAGEKSIAFFKASQNVIRF